MIKKSNFYPALLSMLLGVFLLFGAASNGFAGEPPAPGEKIAGKSSSGVFTVVTIMINDFPVAVTSIVGECNRMPFVVGPVVNNPIEPAGGAAGKSIPDIEASDLENQVLRDADTAGCYEDLGTDDLVINTVRNFLNTGTAISADVTLRAVVSGP